VSSYYEIIDGVRLPAKLGGHPALELCNTFAGWNGEPEVEYLVSYDALALWAGHVGLLEGDRVEQVRAAGARRPKEAAAVLDRAQDFRAALYPLFQESKRTAEPSPVITDELHAAATAVRITPTGATFEWQLPADCGLEAPLLAAAWSAAGLLTSHDMRAVRACPGGGCGWLFLDHRGRRRWCSMATCGNRSKVRRFSARHQAGREAPH
jgi:predicted RNA-binding Zn ribbon-like protein